MHVRGVVNQCGWNLPLLPADGPSAGLRLWPFGLNPQDEACPLRSFGSTDLQKIMAMGLVAYHQAQHTIIF